MRRTKILNATAVKRTTFQEAKCAFMRHCKLRNLRPQTLRYYDEDLTYFHSRVPVRYVDAITQEVCENFLVEELENGKRVSSLNSRIRGLRVFFKFCVEREYMELFPIKLMKEDGCSEKIRRMQYTITWAEKSLAYIDPFVALMKMLDGSIRGYKATSEL